MDASRIVGITLHQDWCAAHGICLMECPEVFSFDGGLVSLTSEAHEHFVSRDSQILAAEASCPVNAIVVETDPPRSPPPIIERDPADTGKSVIQLLKEARSRAMKDTDDVE